MDDDIPYEVTFAAILVAVTGGTPVRRAIAATGTGVNTFYSHIDRTPDAAERYTRARAAMLDALADETVEIADTPLIGKKTRETKDGTFEEVGDNVERTRLMIETRKWLLAKLAPKKYGDLVQLEHSGNIGSGIAERLTDARKRLTGSLTGTE
jgi:hypothetical protein